jgi:hypothetical protein
VESKSTLWNSSDVSTSDGFSFAPVYSHSPGSVVLNLQLLQLVLLLVVLLVLQLLVA